MQIKNTNAIFNSFLKGKISKKEAVNAILVYLFQNKLYFGLETMGEDDFNDFLIYLIPIIGKSFENYSKLECSFATYFQSIVRRNKKNFHRKLLLQKSKQNFIYHISKLDYFDNLEKNDCKNLRVEEEIDTKQSFSNKQLLIIALKCAYFLDDDKIKKIAEKTGYHERYIWNLKKKIDTEMASRYEKNEKRIEAINRRYYLKHKANIYARLQSKEDAVYERAQYLKKFHSMRWEKISHKTNLRFIVPTNQFLSEILGLKETVVANAIVRSRKYVQNMETTKN